MQQESRESTPPSSPHLGTGSDVSTAMTVLIPPASTTLPHTFDAKGLSDVGSLATPSSLDRRMLEKKGSTITSTSTGISQPRDEEGDSDLDQLLMESPTATGSSGRRHPAISSLRFESTHSGYSDSGIFETSSPGSTATQSLARSSTTASKRQSTRPVVRDMYSEYTVSTPLPEEEPGNTVRTTASISLRPTMDASITTDDFYFPLDASVLLPTQTAAPIVLSRATISTPLKVPFSLSTSLSDVQTQTDRKPPKVKRKSTKHIILFRPSHHPPKTIGEPALPRTHDTTDQSRDEHTIDLSTSVPAPSGVILVKSATAATGAAAAMEAKPVIQALNEEENNETKVREAMEGNIDLKNETVAEQEYLSGDESTGSMEASWYQPHHRLSGKAKRFHKKVRRKLKDSEECRVEPRADGGDKDSQIEVHLERKFIFSNLYTTYDASKYLSFNLITLAYLLLF